ncbi:MAG: LUD domain-containing protein [Geminicoccaceae bacterium]|nr:LUD domain-containing protein [Geminicoccaceae bacterium]MCB9942148.1 LUD domain-containing protein [Geminicoccaceae bacterium]
MSSDSRSVVLERIRKSIGRTPEELARARARVAERLASMEPNLVPARGQGDDEHRIHLFTTMATGVQAEVQRLRHWHDIPSATTAWLRLHNLPQKLVMANDARLLQAGWDHQPLLRTHTGTAENEDTTGLTVAESGVAETGTLCLASSPEHPTLLAFLPENSIVAVPSSRILASYEDALRLYSEEHDSPPRSINFITGPSRTGDIGQKLELGAHGPKRLLILLVDGD